MISLNETSVVQIQLLEHMIKGQEELIEDAKIQINKYPTCDIIREIYQSRIEKCEYAIGVMKNWLKYTSNNL